MTSPTPTQRLEIISISEIQPRLNYLAAVSMKNEAVWEALDRHTVGEAIELWLATLSNLTAVNYRSGIKRLTERGYVRPESSLQQFALINHDAIIDRIKTDTTGITWSECTRQARAACYIAFTGFLSRRFQGIIKKASPSKEGSSKTFFKVYEKVKTAAMTRRQWTTFIEALQEINARDCLIAKIVLQGGKRINEVLTLTVQQIDWAGNQITFKQSKTKGSHKETVITYPESVMRALREYIADREGLVFVTRTGKSVPLIQLNNTFAKAGAIARIPFRVTPHVLRASTVTYLKQQGYSDSDIMRVTGHASSGMVYAYDKSSRADNASRKVSLVQ